MSARCNERGQALVWVAIVFVLLLATLALAVDFGNIWSQRRHMQNAADAAALEAARARCFANASAVGRSGFGRCLRQAAAQPGFQRTGDCQ